MKQHKGMFYPRNQQDMQQLAVLLGVRDDWHEPDEQEVTAEPVDGSFDNAGSGDMGLRILKDGKPVAFIHLASLCAIACGHDLAD